MALFAARMNDPQICDAHGPALLPDGALTVRVNRQPTVRVGDLFACGGCPNRVATGAATVTFGGEFAARLTDTTDHGGRIVLGSGNVVIGGPAGMGCVGAGRSTCQAMAAGRASGETHQGYGNCVLESARQIVRRATASEITEDEMLQHSITHGYCVNAPNTPKLHGGSWPPSTIQNLNSLGVPAESMPLSGPSDLGTVKRAVQERRGAIAFVDEGRFRDPPGEVSYHGVLITGVELDKNGNVTAVFINDTGTGECAAKIPADRFLAAMNGWAAPGPPGPLVVTKQPIW